MIVAMRPWGLAGKKSKREKSNNLCGEFIISIREEFKKRGGTALMVVTGGGKMKTVGLKVGYARQNVWDLKEGGL